MILLYLVVKILQVFSHDHVIGIWLVLHHWYPYI